MKLVDHKNGKSHVQTQVYNYTESFVLCVVFCMLKVCVMYMTEAYACMSRDEIVDELSTIPLPMAMYIICFCHL